MRDKSVRFIDWGEALWGIGGAAIWNLLLTSQGTLSTAQHSVWEAYSAGRQQPISEAYVRAARVAFFVSQLVAQRSGGDMPSDDALHDTLITVQQIANLVEGF